MVANTIKIFGGVHKQEEAWLVVLYVVLEDIFYISGDFAKVSAREVGHWPVVCYFVKAWF